MLPVHDYLLEAIRPRVNDPAWTWLTNAREKAASGSVDDLLTVYTGSGGRIGRALLALNDEERQNADELAPGLEFDRWTLADAARAVLLLGRFDATASAGAARDAAMTCYEQGDTAEQQSWLRSLALLPQADRFTPLAIDACRSSIQPLFEAIACENPFAGRFFPERNFNQMVLKSLFNGVAISRIVALTSRLNDDLSRMANDYVSEREAAARSVPTDIWLVLAPRIGENGLDRVFSYLEHDDPAHRYWAAVGLGLRRSADCRPVLERRRGVETDTRTRLALDESLARHDGLPLPESRS